MSEEQERIESEDEDVEGHLRKSKAKFQAAEGGAEDEAEGDDVEAHALRNRPQSL